MASDAIGAIVSPSPAGRITRGAARRQSILCGIDRFKNWCARSAELDSSVDCSLSECLVFGSIVRSQEKSSFGFARVLANPDAWEQSA